METLKKKLLELRGYNSKALEANNDAEHTLDEVIDKLIINTPFWTKERPRFGVTHREDCIIITATWCKTHKQYEYDSHLIQRSECSGYWMWCTIDGIEYGDIADLKADYYITLPKVTRS